MDDLLIWLLSGLRYNNIAQQIRKCSSNKLSAIKLDRDLINDGSWGWPNGDCPTYTDLPKMKEGKVAGEVRCRFVHQNLGHNLNSIVFYPSELRFQKSSSITTMRDSELFICAAHIFCFYYDNVILGVY